ncbi:MAG: Flp pilus assembly complex ATPase component TadA [Phycisphaerales bacterium]|nr:Flp pilus assembly complex ATPase component TadA [Phycisphaerales bacterium]
MSVRSTRNGGLETVPEVPLGQTLVSKGVITDEQLADALMTQREHGHDKLLGEVLCDLGFADETAIAEALAESWGVPFVAQPARTADPGVLEHLPREFVEEHRVLPLFHVRNTLTVAVPDPADLWLIEETARLSGAEVQVAVAGRSEIDAAIQAYLPAANVFVIDDIYEDLKEEDFSVVERQATELADLEEVAGHGPVVKLVNYIVFSAVQEGASDIHIEPDDHRLRVRFRVDGRLYERLSPPHRMHAAIASRVKILSNLDISERRVPQDGDCNVMIEGRPIDLRVSTMPGKFGEKVVIRIIDSRNARLGLDQLGFGAQMLEAWKQVVEQPNGIALVTGPTGSGKSTTLYSVLQSISTDEMNISTIEDPVEARIPGINQSQVNTKAGFTFAGALRAMLRQDPDIIMVGEVRDAETAGIVTQAALTGHLVFSTLHTNDAPSAVTRLVNLGVEPYLVAATLRGVLAQRLVRKICPHCKTTLEPDERTEATIRAGGFDPGQLFCGAGCSRCRNTGYAGRLGVFELMVPRGAVLDAIAAGESLQAIRASLEGTDFRTLRDDGLEKVARGLTTPQEVLYAASQ